MIVHVTESGVLYHLPTWRKVLTNLVYDTRKGLATSVIMSGVGSSFAGFQHGPTPDMELTPHTRLMKSEIRNNAHNYNSRVRAEDTISIYDTKLSGSRAGCVNQTNASLSNMLYDLFWRANKLLLPEYSKCPFVWGSIMHGGQQTPSWRCQHH